MNATDGPLLHLTDGPAWQAASANGWLTTESLTAVGFIHLSTIDQIALPANRLFHGRTDLLLLVIDPAKLSDEVRWERGVPTDPDTMRFPHLYGPLPTAAVTRVVPWQPGSDGRFTAPVFLDATEPNALRDLARHVATTAADFLLEQLGTPALSIETKSTPTDMVTELDRTVEEMLVEDLLRARPDDGTIGEEGTCLQGTSGVRWVIDPIDGTTNLVYGLPGFNISVACELDGQIVAGVVVDPLHRDVFCAAIGAGATRNDEPIHCTTADNLSMALLATGFSYEADRRLRQAQVLTHVLPVVRDIRRIGAAAVDLCWVACGRVDGYYEKGLHYWDYAAGALIAQEAGTLVGDLAGNPTSEAFTLAAPSTLFEPLRCLLVEAEAGDA